MIKRQALLLALVAGIAITPAMAETAGTWTAGIGVGMVDPDSNNGTVNTGAAFGLLDVDVDKSTRPTITGEYFFADNIGVEVLAAWPFKHDIELKTATGAVVDAETKHLPPTVSVQYHFDDLGAATGLGFNVKPFVGVGVNYTNFFDEEIALSGVDLDLNDSWGVAGHVGLDFAINELDAVRIDARYIDIDTDVELNGAEIGTVNIDPWVYGISYIRTF